MITKIGITTLDISEFEDYLQADFSQITRGVVTYNKLFAFAQYIDDRFEHVFDSEDELNEWLTDYVYFIVPIEYVDAISKYNGVVQQAHTELVFNVTCATSVISIAGVDQVIPSSVVSVLPGASAYFDDAGIAIIDAIVDSWNTANPKRAIPEPYRFDSYKELIAYRDKCQNLTPTPPLP